jgi:hypothetical protein
MQPTLKNDRFGIKRMTPAFLLSLPDSIYSPEDKALSVVTRWNPIAPSVPLIIKDINTRILPPFPKEVKHIILSNLHGITHLDLTGIEKLSSLVVEYCPMLVEITNIPPTTRSMHIICCKNLLAIDQLPRNLSYARFDTLKNLKYLPSLPRHLRELVISDMPLKEIPLRQGDENEPLPFLPEMLTVTLNGELQNKYFNAQWQQYHVNKNQAAANYVKIE